MQISGDGISRSSIGDLLEILSQNTGEIGVPVQQFGQGQFNNSSNKKSSDQI